MFSEKCCSHSFSVPLQITLAYSAIALIRGISQDPYQLGFPGLVHVNHSGQTSYLELLMPGEKTISAFELRGFYPNALMNSVEM